MAAEEDRRRVEREREEARIEALRLETSARGENTLRRRSFGSADGAGPHDPPQDRSRAKGGGRLSVYSSRGINGIKAVLEGAKWLLKSRSMAKPESTMPSRT
jgi:hypothetical protein